MSLLEAALFGLGLVLLLSALGWRARRGRRARELVRQALADRDPDIRLAAIRVVGSEGFARYATMLLERTRYENDPVVVSVLAQLVVDNQWEPADNAALIRLRLWAHHYLTGPPTLAVGAGRAEPVPQLPDVVGEVLPVLYLSLIHI